LETSITIDPIESFSYLNIKCSILRLDKIHPIVSGNKWFKLRYYIKDATAHQATTLASFGGPYSNHLVALAYAAKMNNLKSIGYVRATKNDILTPSLQEAKNYGMHLEFIGRTHFQKIKNEFLATNYESNKYTSYDKKTGVYYIDEGGYGNLGAEGAATILNEKTKDYDFIIAAVGTGTMLAGLINAAAYHQKVIGISVLKNEASITAEIKNLLIDKKKTFTLLSQFHQGGYAKINSTLVHFMNELWQKEKIPTDIVYTGKLLLAVSCLVKEKYFKEGSKILVIHSGGLQGNRSLPKGQLDFE